MPWAKLDDHIDENPKLLSVSVKARWLYVCGLSYSARWLSDGFIPRAALTRIAGDLTGPTSLARELVNADLWETTEGGYLIHDWSQYNRPAAEMKAERAAARERMQRLRSARGSPATREHVRPKFGDPVPVPEPENPSSKAALGSEEQPIDDEFGPDLGPDAGILTPDEAHAIRAIRRQNGSFRPTPSVVARLRLEHGRGTVIETLGAIQLGAAGLGVIEKPNAYLEKAVKEHAGNGAASRTKSTSKGARK